MTERIPRLPPGLLLLLLPLAALGVFFVYPLAEMLRRSIEEFADPQQGGLDNYRWFFETDVNVTVLRRTVLVAFSVTFVCLLLAYPYAYVMTRVGPRWRMLMLGCALLPFWTSLMVRNYAWMVLLQDNGPLNDALAAVGIGRLELIGTVRAVIIGMVQILLPFMILPLYATLRGIDRRLLDAAQSLGARPAVAFARVYLPLSLPGALAGSLLVFVLALGFYITPALLGSPSNALLSELVVTQINELLAWGRGGAMGVILLVLTLALLGLAALLTRRSRAYLSEDGT